MYFDSSWSADYLHVCITLHQFENFAFFILKLSIWFELTWFVHHFILFENFHLKFIYYVVMCSENRQKWCNHAWSVQNEFKLNDTNLNMKHIIITTLCVEFLVPLIGWAYFATDHFTKKALRTWLMRAQNLHISAYVWSELSEPCQIYVLSMNVCHTQKNGFNFCSKIAHALDYQIS